MVTARASGDLCAFGKRKGFTAPRAVGVDILLLHYFADGLTVIRVVQCVKVNSAVGIAVALPVGGACVSVSFGRFGEFVAVFAFDAV